MDNTYFDLFDDDKFYLVIRQQYAGNNTKFDAEQVKGQYMNNSIETYKEWVKSTGKAIAIMEYTTNRLLICPSVIIENNL